MHLEESTENYLQTENSRIQKNNSDSSSQERGNMSDTTTAEHNNHNNMNYIKNNKNNNNNNNGKKDSNIFHNAATTDASEYSGYNDYPPPRRHNNYRRNKNNNRHESEKSIKDTEIYKEINEKSKSESETTMYLQFKYTDMMTILNTVKYSEEVEKLLKLAMEEAESRKNKKTIEEQNQTKQEFQDKCGLVMKNIPVETKRQDVYKAILKIPEMLDPDTGKKRFTDKDFPGKCAIRTFFYPKKVRGETRNAFPIFVDQADRDKILEEAQNKNNRFNLPVEFETKSGKIEIRPLSIIIERVRSTKDSSSNNGNKDSENSSPVNGPVAPAASGYVGPTGIRGQVQAMNQFNNQGNYAPYNPAYNGNPYTPGHVNIYTQGQPVYIHKNNFTPNPNAQTFTPSSLKNSNLPVDEFLTNMKNNMFASGNSSPVVGVSQFDMNSANASGNTTPMSFTSNVSNSSTPMKPIDHLVFNQELHNRLHQNKQNISTGVNQEQAQLFSNLNLNLDLPNVEINNMSQADKERLSSNASPIQGFSSNPISQLSASPPSEQMLINSALAAQRQKLNELATELIRSGASSPILGLPANPPINNNSADPAVLAHSPVATLANQIPNLNINFERKSMSANSTPIYFNGNSDSLPDFNQKNNANQQIINVVSQAPNINANINSTSPMMSGQASPIMPLGAEALMQVAKQYVAANSEQNRPSSMPNDLNLLSHPSVNLTPAVSPGNFNSMQTQQTNSIDVQQ